MVVNISIWEKVDYKIKVPGLSGEKVNSFEFCEIGCSQFERTA